MWRIKGEERSEGQIADRYARAKLLITLLEKARRDGSIQIQFDSVHFNYLAWLELNTVCFMTAQLWLLTEIWFEILALTDHQKCKMPPSAEKNNTSA